MGKKYAIGIDYGTQSGRAVLVDLADGTEVADHVTPYPHGVIDETLPGSGKRLEPDWALQHPDDYIEVLRRSVPAVLEMSGVDPGDVIGIGIDFTACTMLPVDAQGTPLCLLPEFRGNPHSWVKLWKHHAAQDEANKINRIAEERGEPWLKRYGGKISSEWMIAKVWQILDEAPEIYDAADQFLEATDWVIAQLSGRILRNSCTAGYKAIWHKRDGYPSRDYFKALDPRLENLTETKLRGEIVPLGTRAGGLTPEMAKITGLREGTAVAVGNVDAHAAVPGVGVTEPGKLVMAMGTSICHMLLGTEEREVEGMCGVVEDGIIPGYFGYEAGQSAVGDIFEWYVTEAVPAYVKEEAEREGVSVHEWLEARAARLKPGESGLIALDWWNGNRSVLVDADLTGAARGDGVRHAQDRGSVRRERRRGEGAVRVRRAAAEEPAAHADLRRRDEPRDQGRGVPADAGGRRGDVRGGRGGRGSGRLRFDRGGGEEDGARAGGIVQADSGKRGDLRPAVQGIHGAARLFRTRRQRRDETAESAQGGGCASCLKRRK